MSFTAPSDEVALNACDLLLSCGFTIPLLLSNIRMFNRLLNVSLSLAIVVERVGLAECTLLLDKQPPLDRKQCILALAEE